MGVCGIGERTTSFEVPTAPQQTHFTGDQSVFSTSTDRETSGAFSVSQSNIAMNSHSDESMFIPPIASDLPMGTFIDAGSVIDFMMADRKTFDYDSSERTSSDEYFSRRAGRFLSSSDYTVFYLDEEQQILGEIETVERFDQRMGTDFLETPCQRDTPYDNYEELMTGRHRRSGNTKVHPADLTTIRDRVLPLSIYGWPSSPLDIPGRAHANHYAKSTFLPKIRTYITEEPVNQTTAMKDTNHTQTQYITDDSATTNARSDNDSE